MRGWGPIRKLLVERERESSSGCITQQEEKKLSFLAFVPARVSSESNKL